MPGLPFPTINGNELDWSSVQIIVPGIPLPLDGVKDLSYSDDLKPGKARGTRSQVVARSRGTYDGEGSITFYKSQFNAFLTLLAGLSTIQLLSFKEFPFSLMATYFEPYAGVYITDTLLGCRITKDEDQHAEGGEVLVHKCTLDILQVNWSGAAPVTKSLFP